MRHSRSPLQNARPSTRRYNTDTSTIATDPFSAPYGGVVLGAAVGVGGAIFSWLFQRQGTLMDAWVAHMMADLALMAVGYQVLAG